MSLKLNPSARISILDSGHAPSFLVEAPMKGASLSCVRVDAENLPGAYAFLHSTLIDGCPDVQIGDQDAAELRQIGLFAATDAMPQPVEYRFPARGPGPLAGAGPSLRIGDLGALPMKLSLPGEWAEQVLQFEPHHHGSVWAPIRVAGDAATRGLPDAERSHFSPSETVLDTEATRAAFAREGFAILDGLLPAEHVAELARYFRALASEGFLSCHEDRGTRRHVAHNHPVARFWHDQLNERVSQLAGRRTKPSYSFVSLYMAGGDLFWHTDRPPCEYTVTLLIDYSPLDPDGRSPWALKVKGRDGTLHALHLRVGEALILRGRELRHGRDVLPDGHSSSSLLFHFVDEEYDGVME